MKGFMIVKKLSEKQGKLTEEEWQRIDQILCEECGVIAHKTIHYGDFGLTKVFKCKCGKIEKNYGFKVVEKGDKFKIVKNIDCEDKMTAAERETIKYSMGIIDGVALTCGNEDIKTALISVSDLLTSMIMEDSIKPNGKYGNEN